MSSTFFEFYIEEITTEENITNNCIMYNMLVVLLSQTQGKYITFSPNFANIQWILRIFVSFYE